MSSEAQYGRKAWAELGLVPREMWMAYLVWYRSVLRIPVQNGSRATAIEPLDAASAAAGFRVTVQRASGAREELRARKVVLATGIQGGGEW